MPQNKIYKEYTGTGAGGGNARDGNNITSPRVGGEFFDDEEAMEHYMNKNIYGGEGGQKVGDMYRGNYPNRDPRGGMFEMDADDYGDATLTTQGNMRSRFTKTGMPPGMMEDLNKIKQEIKELAQLKEQGQSAEDAAHKRRIEALQKQIIRLQMRHANIKKGQAKAQAAQGISDIDDSFDEQIKALKDQLAQIGQEGGEQQNENIMKDYFKNTNINLMERMDSYRKEAKRNILMEGAMKTFFEKFDSGMTNEEIIQDYASKGTQVPEQFVTTARKQYEGYKKLQLELEMSEKEFKNSATKIVNNPEEGAVMEPDAKQLASGLFNEEKKEKKDKKEKEIKGKINIDTDEVEVLDDVEDVDGVTINIKEQKLKEVISKIIKNKI